ncbi:MAG TPA: DUF305 domain-containing protein [Longimicrobium sp.]|nr:DUF305 domain-containing protein [Longimicrobium sp.]
MKPSFHRTSAAALLVLATAACGTASGQARPAAAPPAPPAGANVPAPPAAGANGPQRRYTEADVRFMQGMIAHHAQAVVMTRLVPTHTERADIRLVAQRIDLSQQDEMAMMRRWLQDRGEPVPAADAAHAHHAGMDHAAAGHGSMPGMLTAEELARLEAARGAEFDRLFLQYMIRHHEGALTMVEQLLASPGAGQEPELFGFVSDVDADQRAEIARMQGLLAALPPAATPR